MKKLLFFAMALSFIICFNASNTFAQKTVYEARLEPAKLWMDPNNIVGPEIRGEKMAPITFIVGRDGTGRSRCKAIIKTDSQGTATLTLIIKGFHYENPPPGYERPPVDVLVDCGGYFTWPAGENSVIYEDVMVLNDKGNGKVTIDISDQLPCLDPAVVPGKIGTGGLGGAEGEFYWTLAPTAQ